jgi:poly-beta-1,6 N-acetyl-D-glucosamine synthase
MEFLPFVYLAYMFVSFYLLLLTLLLYFKNKQALFSHPKLTKEYSISIIIPTYNEEKTIVDTIKSVYNIDYSNIKEVFVVNDGSKDNTSLAVRKILNKYKNLKLIDKENSGKADSINQTLKKCTGELVVVLDADSYAFKESFKKMVGYFDDEKVGAVTAMCTPRNRSTLLEKLQVIEYKVIAFTRKLLEFIDSIYVVPGTAGMYRRKALEEIGGFDTKNITEDIEATWHLAKNGWKIRMCLSASVTTEVPNKLKPWYRQRRRWALGGLQCISKYKSYIFQNNMFGYFIVPFFTLGLFLGLIGMIIFLYVFGRRFLSSYLLTRYSLESSTALLNMNNFYITPSILNYFGLILLFLFFIFNIYVLSIMKDRILEKQSFFNLIFYMIVYLMVYPFTLIAAMIHYARKKNVWR